MEFISSDTNVWLDFYYTDQLDLPFRLPYKYLMYAETIKSEILYPPELANELLDRGLVPVEITLEEFQQAELYSEKYKQLSVHDRIALAIAKCRNIALLTGDKALRKSAQKEGVHVFGTIGIIDRLRPQGHMSVDELVYCLEHFITEMERNTAIRLPIKELLSRLQELKHLK